MNEERLVYDAYENQWSLIGWLKTEQGRKFIASFLDSYTRSNKTLFRREDGTAFEGPDIEPREFATAAEGWARSLAEATTYAVTPEIDAFIASAAESMEQEAAWEEDLPVRRGFIWLPTPRVVIDKRGKQCSVRALSWQTALAKVHTPGDQSILVPTIEVAQWSDRDVAWDQDLQEMRSAAHWDWMGYPKCVLLHIQPVWLGQPYSIPTAEADANLRLAWEDGRNLYRWLRCFWAFVQQDVIAVGHARLPRPFLRRAQRERRPVDAIRIVTLRRARYLTGDGDPHAVEWSHRWAVRGHWRWIDDRDTGRKRQVWVRAYVKGPPDKPFVGKVTLHKVAR